MSLRTSITIESGQRGSWLFSKFKNHWFHIKRQRPLTEHCHTLDALGEYWLIARVHCSGKFSFFSEGIEIACPTRRWFWIFYPPWSLTVGELSDSSLILEGVMSRAALPSNRFKHACMFHHSSTVFPTDTKEVVALLSEATETITIESCSSPPVVARKTKNLIDCQFREPTSIGALAKQLRLSPTIFGRLFKKQFGITPVTYRNQLRIMAACVALMNGSSIMETMQEIGFNDLSRFNKQFKKVAATTPKRYKSQKNQHDL